MRVRPAILIVVLLGASEVLRCAILPQDARAESKEQTAAPKQTPMDELQKAFEGDKSLVSEFDGLGAEEQVKFLERRKELLDRAIDSVKSRPARDRYYDPFSDYSAYDPLDNKWYHSSDEYPRLAIKGGDYYDPDGKVVRSILDFDVVPKSEAGKKAFNSIKDTALDQALKSELDGDEFKRSVARNLVERMKRSSEDERQVRRRINGLISKAKQEKYPQEAIKAVGDFLEEAYAANRQVSFPRSFLEEVLYGKRTRTWSDGAMVFKEAPRARVLAAYFLSKSTGYGEYALDHLLAHIFANEGQSMASVALPALENYGKLGPKAISVLAKGLQNGSSYVKKYGSALLAELVSEGTGLKWAGGDEVDRLLLKLVEDKDVEVARAATNSLKKRLAFNQNPETMVSVIASGDSELGKIAQNTLLKQGKIDQKTLKSLSELLDQGKSGSKALALDLLAELTADGAESGVQRAGGREVDDHLYRIWKKDDQELGGKIVSALRKRAGVSKDYAFLLQELESGAPERIGKLLEFTKAFPIKEFPELIGSLEKMARSASEKLESRAGALEALLASNPDQVRYQEIARAWLKDRRRETRRAAAGILGKLGKGDPDLVMALFEAFRVEMDPETRLALIRALDAAQVTDPYLLSVLADHLNEPDATMKEALLRLFRGKELETEVQLRLAKALMVKDDILRGAAAQALGQASHIDLVVAGYITSTGLKHESAEVRSAVASVFRMNASLDPVSNERLALALLSEKDPAVRLELAGALEAAKSSDPMVFENLQKALFAEKDPVVKARLISAFAQNPATDDLAIRPLRELLNSGNPELKAAAEAALKKVAERRPGLDARTLLIPPEVAHATNPNCVRPSWLTGLFKKKANQPQK